MLFNRKGINQKKWRMVKKGKHFLFGCTLFLVTGAIGLQQTQVVSADEVASPVITSMNSAEDGDDRDRNQTSKEEIIKPGDNDINLGVASPLSKKSDELDKKEDVAKTEINKQSLITLIEKIKKIDLSKKTKDSVEKLNLSLSRAQQLMESPTVSQEEVDKEEKALKESFEKLEDKPEKEKASESSEKTEPKKEETSDSSKENSEKIEEGNKEEFARKQNEKITKVTEIVSEIHGLANQINYEFSDAEKELVKTAEKLSEDSNREGEVESLLKEVTSLRNKVANRMTREHSGKRDSRNGKPIDRKEESGFRGVVYTHKENRRNGNLIENGSTAVYYNSDEIWSLIAIKGERVGNERKFTTYVRGKVVEDVTPYYIVTVGFTGNSPIKGLKMYVAYWDKSAGVQRSREIEYGKTEINNPITNAAIRGIVGEGTIVQPGRYEVQIASNTRVAPNQLKPYTFTFIIKPQSERNTVKDLSQTYVDDVRHLTETEKTALIEKFKTEHPDVMTPSGHKSDFDHAEVSADGSTMTIHFKDGFAPKTIQTNATNDVEAKHSSLTAYIGDSKELYTNPRALVRSKTGNEVPTTAQVTYKTPFNLQQAGTRNVVVTTTYQNGVIKDVTTPYTVLDFIGKQDKKINQNQSGQLGDARNYVTVSDNSAIPSELTVRWKGGSSTVDTSVAGVQNKEIEILRGNHLMKTVNIPVEIVDDIKPIITAPDNVTLTRLEGLPGEINIQAKDNDKGVGLKDGNAVTVENLPAPLMYNAAKSKIEINGVIPNNFQLGKSSIQVTVKVVDKKGNTATKNIIFNIQSQTQKYTAVANPEIQEVSYGETPDAGTSIQKKGLPTETRYSWVTKPSTTTGPGDKAGVVTVTYPDGSTDTVNVTVKVRKLSDEHTPTGKKITVNQNNQVTNDTLKSAVTVDRNGTSKVKSVTAAPISTENAGTQTIRATVTYLDNTTDSVDIPLEVKDVTPPTIQSPTNGQNIDLIALDKVFSPIKVMSEDNVGGSGVKTTTVTGLPDFLVYDNATKTIKFKNGVQEVTKLPVGQDSKTYTATIEVTDNANNPSQRQFTITVKSMTTKYNATPNRQKQTVSYGATPDAGTSINKNGLPAGTTYTWATTPSTITTKPGDKQGVVTVTYPDGSKDTVDVMVNVRALNGEYEPTATKITKNQNESVSNDELKAAVTINNNGNSKVKSVTPVSTISTVEFGNKTINAIVTYLDDTTDPVTIPLEVKDKTAPTITTPTENQTWEITALDKTLPPIKVAVADNPGGSGIKSIVPMNLPSFLKYDKATSSIVFQDGESEVPKLSGINRTTRNITLRVEDNAGNSSERTFSIVHMSMAEKYNPQANAMIQEVSHGEAANPKSSVNTTGLPTDAQYTWKSTPDTSRPGNKTGIVKVTYPDDSVDEVTVTVKVRKLSDEYEPTATKIVKNQNETVSNEDLKSAITINKNGNSKVKIINTVGTISTAKAGNKEITATVTYLDDTTDTVTIPLEVKDVIAPTIQSPTNGQNIDLIALDKAFPPIKVTSEDNTGGSGVKSTTVTDLPDFLTYDDATKTIKFKEGTQEVPKLAVGTDSQTHTVTIRVIDNANNSSTSQLTITVKSMTTKYDATPNSEKQKVSYGKSPDAATSVNKTNLPEGTSYVWKTQPDTNTPGEKDGVVEVTYKDGSKDTVNVKVTVKELSSEYEVTGSPIEVNQNDPVTNDDLKAKVTATSKVGNVNGTDKISSVEPKSQISTASYGEQRIIATVTFKDGTTKEVTIPLKVKDVTKPTIQSPTNGQSLDLIAVEGSNPNIAVTSEDNTGGSGVNTTTITGLPDFLEYNESTKQIQFKEGVTSVPSLPEGTDVQPYNVTITVVDNAGNEATTNVTITVKSMTTKYDATPNSEKQTVSYGATPDAGTSVDKTSLPEGTSYDWKTTPVTTTPGEKDGVVEVTYKDGSKDTVNIKVTVKELSSEYEVTGSLIEVNQNTPVTNDDLKAKVTATSKVGNVSGTDKIAKVEPKAQVSTAVYGETNIEATVTFKDGTTKPVTIPLKVKDVTPPTITAPAENTNWETTALDKALPNMEVRAEDNANGSGIKNVTVTGLPDYLEYDSATHTIKFKSGNQEVEKLQENTPSKEFTLNIRAEDNAGNVSERAAKITVSSMSEKTNPQPKDQTVNYGQTPNPEDSVNKQGLPDGTTVTWKTPPVVDTPGATTGEVEITYPDGSKDVITVNVTVKKVSEEFTATGTQVEVNQNAEVTSDMLKGSVNATNAQGENGNAKIAKVESKAPINTEAYGEQIIQAKVTYIDGSEQDVTIPLKVKDVTNPAISTPVENTNWEMTALDKTLPSMKIKAEDNANGSGIATIEVNNMPSFLTFDESTGTIVFKEGLQEVPKIESDNVMYGVTIVARDKAGNSTSKLVNITVWSMRGKYNPTGIAQEVDNGHVPDPETSVNKTGLPEGTTVTWKTTPDVSTPGSHPGVALVHYPDGTEDEVEVPVTVKKQSDTFAPTAKEPNQTVRHNEVPDPEKSINTNGLPEGTTYTWSEQSDTSKPGSKTGKVLITYPDKSTEEVTVTVNVTPQKDEYNPTGIAQEVDNGHVPDPETSVNKTGLPEGTTVTWKTTPDVSTPGSHPGVALVHYPDGTEDEVEVPVTVKKQSDTFTPTAKEPNQTVRHNEVPDPEKSINTNDLPEGTTYTWSEQPDTSKPGSKTGKVLITYPDKSTEEVTVTVNVTPQKDDYDPQPKAQTVDNGAVPEAKNSIGNVDGLPTGTTFEWKDGAPNTAVGQPGEVSGTVIVRYPDGKSEEVSVKVNVKGQADTYTPEKVEVKQKETQTILPKTGTENNLGLLSAATSSILFGLGFFILSKKEDEE